MSSNLYSGIPSGKNPPEDINVVVEIPLGSTSKFQYDETAGYMTLDRVMHSPFHFVYEYGFIPQTHAGDGDALDVLLLASRPTFPGCVVRARIIGALLSEDEEGEDNKFLAVPHEKVDPHYSEYKDINDVPKHLLKEIEHFMKDYKLLEEGKHEHVNIKDWKDKSYAMKLVEAGIEAYHAKSSS